MDPWIRSLLSPASVEERKDNEGGAPRGVVDMTKCRRSIHKASFPGDHVLSSRLHEA
jgi:hypothetical protein